MEWTKAKFFFFFLSKGEGEGEGGGVLSGLGSSFIRSCCYLSVHCFLHTFSQGVGQRHKKPKAIDANFLISYASCLFSAAAA